MRRPPFADCDGSKAYGTLTWKISLSDYCKCWRLELPQLQDEGFWSGADVDEDRLPTLVTGLMNDGHRSPHKLEPQHLEDLVANSLSIMDKFKLEESFVTSKALKFLHVGELQGWVRKRDQEGTVYVFILYPVYDILFNSRTPTSEHTILRLLPHVLEQRLLIHMADGDRNGLFLPDAILCLGFLATASSKTPTPLLQLMNLAVQRAESHAEDESAVLRYRQEAKRLKDDLLRGQGEVLTLSQRLRTAETELGDMKNGRSNMQNLLNDHVEEVRRVRKDNDNLKKSLAKSEEEKMLFAVEVALAALKSRAMSAQEPMTDTDVDEARETLEEWVDAPQSDAESNSSSRMESPAKPERQSPTVAANQTYTPANPASHHHPVRAPVPAISGSGHQLVRAPASAISGSGRQPVRAPASAISGSGRQPVRAPVSANPGSRHQPVPAPTPAISFLRPILQGAPRVPLCVKDGNTTSPATSNQQVIVHPTVISEREKELDACKSELARVQSKLAEKEIQCVRVMSQMEIMRSMLDDRIGANGKLREECGGAKKAVELLNAEVERLHSEGRAKQSTITRLEQDVSRLQHDLLEQERRKTTLKAEVPQLRQPAPLLRSDSSSLDIQDLFRRDNSNLNVQDPQEETNVSPRTSYKRNTSAISPPRDAPRTKLARALHEYASRKKSMRASRMTIEDSDSDGTDTRSRSPELGCPNPH
ncbi:hypothetical protein HDU93_007327, partial [Gonapodya sp. JEL0774]